MSNFEVGFCSLEDYEKGQESRIDEAHLRIDSFYTAMFRLEHEHRQAAKFPLRIIDVEVVGIGCDAKFSVLNADLQEKFNSTGHFLNGFWCRDKSQGIAIQWNDGAYKTSVQEAYLRDYDDGFGGGRSIWRSINLPAEVAV